MAEMIKPHPTFHSGDPVVVKREDSATVTVWQPAIIVSADTEKIAVVFADGSRLVVEANRGLVRLAPKRGANG